MLHCVAGSVSMNGGMNVVNNQMSFRPCSEGMIDVLWVYQWKINILDYFFNFL